MSANETAVIADAMADFFAPTSTDMVQGLVAEYRRDRQRIADAVKFAESDAFKGVWHYFAKGNANEHRGHSSLTNSVEQAFREAGAVGVLNATYWNRALELTDVYDAMPQARRSQWHEQMRNPEGIQKDYSDIRRDREAQPELFDAKGEYLNPADAMRLPRLPDFEEETVRSTLLELLNSRAKFLAERVDGIFRALSGEHVTNSPAAFSKRMIIGHLVSSYGTTTDRVGFINDLRCVIAKFMGRDEPGWNATGSVVTRARREKRGEWVTLDGGALRLRAYKCGTAHLEVHPDMAWRLNCVLAQLYPLAIPPEFRAKPKKKVKDFVMMGRPLPFAVVGTLESLETAYNFIENTGPNAWREKYRREPIKNGLVPRGGFSAEAERVIAYIGGVKAKNERGTEYFAFDYDPREVIAEIICTGCLPDQQSHQYYPTPESLARVAVEMAQIEPHHECLEPSAGTGGIADLLPKTVTTCVEISPLHCKVLEAKGHNVVEADFLKWEGIKFDRIVMNPPFASGRWQLHIEHAAGMLADDGRLVAILPASAKNRDVLPGWTLEWSRVFDNEFAGASVSVVILAATR